MRAAVQTNGAYLTVRDEEIIAAIADLGVNGIFAEPAGSTSLAGLKKAIAAGIISTDDPVLILNTGNGLKDVRAAMLAVPNAAIIEPTMDSLKKFLNK